MAANSVESEVIRNPKQRKIEEAYWYRRLINADYFKQIKKIISDGSYL